MRLDGFGLLVNDMAKMIRFYRDVLGFEIREPENSSNVYLVNKLYPGKWTRHFATTLYRRQ